jgi:hypothetical protein
MRIVHKLPRVPKLKVNEASGDSPTANAKPPPRFEELREDGNNIETKSRGWRH